MVREHFPILTQDWRSPRVSLPFAALLPYEQQAIRNHAQDLDTLARRGGCTWEELQAIVEGWNLCDCGTNGRPWPDPKEAERIVRAAINHQQNAAQGGGEK